MSANNVIHSAGSAMTTLVIISWDTGTFPRCFIALFWCLVTQFKCQWVLAVIKQQQTNNACSSCHDYLSLAASPFSICIGQRKGPFIPLLSLLLYYLEPRGASLLFLYSSPNKITLTLFSPGAAFDAVQIYIFFNFDVSLAPLIGEVLVNWFNLCSHRSGISMLNFGERSVSI